MDFLKLELLDIFYFSRFENIISNIRDSEENEIACKAHVRIKHKSTHVDGKWIINKVPSKTNRIPSTIDVAETENRNRNEGIVAFSSGTNNDLIFSYVCV